MHIRMRDDVKTDLKRTKQQIISFCTRHGFHYEGKTRWTQAYFKWLDSLAFENELYKETFQEYLALYYTLDEKIAVYDARIEELAHQERYEENVRKLCCFKGISAHTALSLLVEVGDFHRFRTAQHFSAYLGLVPGESSSGEKVIHTNITKAAKETPRFRDAEATQEMRR